VIVGCEFGVNVESINCVHVGSFFVILQHLHNVVYVPKECASSFKCFAKLYGWLLFRKACLCWLYRILKLLPVCPTYALWHSGQASLYTPDNENLSRGGLFCVSRFPMVLFVRKAILRSICLNMLVM